MELLDLSRERIGELQRHERGRTKVRRTNDCRGLAKNGSTILRFHGCEAVSGVQTMRARRCLYLETVSAIMAIHAAKPNKYGVAIPNSLGGKMPNKNPQMSVFPGNR